MARFSVKTDASEHLQEVFTKNIRVRMALYDVRQTALAEAMHLTQATLSTKLNRRTEWTVADIANAAVFFREPVENLVSASALEAIGSGSNYQLVHDAPVIILNMSLLVPPAAPQLVRVWHDTTGNRKEAKKTKRAGPSDLARS
ncbi:hypothetical protein [Bifidobacterium dentium]|uniref:hypothetical protein n=1 Tax=Bifidobacterium dentium TaxID=1689 RepID=UPI0014480C8F|nr:hypothetical protein [Bifidobacterium dentium]